jgi:hypothetical protein
MSWKLSDEKIVSAEKVKKKITGAFCHSSFFLLVFSSSFSFKSVFSFSLLCKSGNLYSFLYIFSANIRNENDNVAGMKRLEKEYLYPNFS